LRHSVYIDDLPEYIDDSVECDFDLFADDAKLSKHVRGTADAGMLQLGFNRLFDQQTAMKALHY